MKKIYIIIAIGLMVHLSWAQSSRYAGSFLELGIGARALGMGGAQVALSNDATGFYWNPAGLAFLPNIQAATMYARLFNTLETQSYGSIAIPIFGGATVSLAWMRLAVDDIPVYNYEDNQAINAYQRIHGLAEPLTGEPGSFFSSADDAYIISFAKYVPWNLDLGWQYFEIPIDVGFGFNLKMIRQKLFENTGSGVGLDAGMIVRIGLNEIFSDPHYGDLAFGINVQDFANTQISWNTDSRHKDRIARNFKYGFSYIQPLSALNSQFTFSFDLNSRYTGSINLGMEYLYNSRFAVRFGTNAGFVTAGAGIYLWKFHLDYAFQSHDLGNSHRVSLQFGL